MAVRRGGGEQIFYEDLHAALATPVAIDDKWWMYGPAPPPCPGEDLSEALGWLAADRSRCPLLETAVRLRATPKKHKADGSEQVYN